MNLLQYLVPSTDNPLKILFKGFPKDLTEWLLGKSIKSIEKDNIELPASAIRSDQLYAVTLTGDEKIMLHVEFEAKDNTEVMKWRMLDYMSRMTNESKKLIQSVVLYLEFASGVQ